MYSFEIVNHVAVLGTTLLLMAIATIWYSSMAFGGILQKESGRLPETKSSVIQLALTFIAYFAALVCIGYAVVLSPLISLPPLLAAIGMAVIVASITFASAIMEGKSLKYTFVHVGFYSLFIVGGAVVLLYWPW